jgi:uncharacterized protein
MITDIHFHLFGVENSEDIFLSQKMRDKPVFKFVVCPLLFLHEGSVSNQSALKWAMDVILKSKQVDNVVALAFDWVYVNGKPSCEKSNLFISNDWVAEQASRMPEKMYFGASVNPNREDAIDELKRVKQLGAVLIKIIPSAQNIDLADATHKTFFDTMRELNLPLLCHTGVEHTIPPVDGIPGKNLLNKPAKLVQALECGVKVIAAHCALPIKKEDGEADYEELKKLFACDKYKELLYADIAAFFVPFRPLRAKMVEKVKNDLPHDRLILGSDFPMLPTTLLTGDINNFTLDEVIELLFTTNPLDRNVIALRDMGFQECVFSNVEKILNI